MPSGGGTQRLPRIIGPGKAMEMVLTGVTIDAGEACRIGLLNQSRCSKRSLMSTAISLADEMATKSPLSLSYAKEALYQRNGSHAGSGIEDGDGPLSPCYLPPVIAPKE